MHPVKSSSRVLRQIRHNENVYVVQVLLDAIYDTHPYVLYARVTRIVNILVVFVY